MTFYAGAYAAAFGGNALGITEDSFEWEFSSNGDPVKGDNLGDITQDLILRGGDMFLSFTLIEWNAAGLQSLIWLPSSTFGRVDATWIGKTAVIGDGAGTANAKALLLTKVTGPNAVPSSLAFLAMLAEGFPIRTLLGPRLRRVPVRVRCFPYLASGNTVFFI